METGYQVIARRWRPRQFEELVGQEHIVRTLKNAIEQKRIAHAYLFVGPRGTGKTTTARLFAKALNAEEGPCIHPNNDSKICQAIMAGSCMDVIEIDGASNNSVAQVRDLREYCRYAPAQCRYKIYIIDEVHMLSTGAFNALLKILEEPPAHVKFLFATTEAHKILATITSRCQRFEFRPISEETIIEKLRFIAQEEKINVEANALKAIARMANGGMRDAQSILDQLIAFCGDGINEQDVLEVYGLAGTEQLMVLGQSIASADYEKLLGCIDFLVSEGRDLYRTLVDLQALLRESLVDSIRNGGKTERYGQPLSTESLMRVLDSLHTGEVEVQRGLSDRVNFEVTLFRAIEASRSRAIDSLIKSLAQHTAHPKGESSKKKIEEPYTPKEAIQTPNLKVKDLNEASIEKNTSMEEAVDEPIPSQLTPTAQSSIETGSQKVVEAFTPSTESQEAKVKSPISAPSVPSLIEEKIPESNRRLLEEKLRGRFMGIYDFDPKKMI